ncbi:pyridine nucleotide transhydrogenase [Bacillus sp. sid0103]|uniref:pyridine nucleotide transhydrogenase n=1 Tax=Bacillus sp. sid0103 TaxID=2856337 RepID=UPI001C43FCDD|nr:pyridine nucleotide transhydrogenase [Bacillus sp. sid0103]MBV7504090.1 pyridine nucleotide transhydrogenase [Bacillus sp. sid0103]
MVRGLIGYTGLVGGILSGKMQFDTLYNSKNITDIQGEKFDYLICAGAPGLKWKANQDPEKDLQNIKYLIANLQSIKADKFILISTFDVYHNPLEVDEASTVSMEGLHPYGKHRRYLEEFVEDKFDQHLIVRLPALFGRGLKKNFIYDLIHHHCLHWTHKDSTYQFYNLENLSKDIRTAEENQIKLLNISTEPLSAQFVAKECLNMDFQNITERASITYNVKSKYFSVFSGANGYLYSKEDVLAALKEFIHQERLKITP